MVRDCTGDFISMGKILRLVYEAETSCGASKLDQTVDNFPNHSAFSNIFRHFSLILQKHVRLSCSFSMLKIKRWQDWIIYTVLWQRTIWTSVAREREACFNQGCSVFIQRRLLQAMISSTQFWSLIIAVYWWRILFSRKQVIALS